MNVEIRVENPEHVCKGIESLEIDGKKIGSAKISAELIHDGSTIRAVMGKNALPVENERL
jgi:hypothetical protein